MTSRRRRLILVMVVTVLAAVTTACGKTDSGPQVVEFVVPAGTADRLALGEKVVVMPDELQLRVGDTLRIRNDDSVAQAVGPYLVDAGAEFELTYGSPGRFQGVCLLSEGNSYDIVVSK